MPLFKNMWFMVSVAFHRLVLKYNFMLERRASSCKVCAVVVNTMYSITFSSAFLQSYCHSCGFSLNPPVFQYPLGMMDARTGYAFPSLITSVSDTELMMCLRGQKNGCFSAAAPWATLRCWRKQSNLSTSFPAH